MAAEPTHHPGCDGWRTSHPRLIEVYPGYRLLRCSECDCTTLYGSSMTRAEAERYMRCQSRWEPCDGRCMSWSA